MYQNITKLYSIILTCMIACAFTTLAQSQVPEGKVYVLSDITSTTNLAGGELIAPSNNPQIVLSWNLAILNVNDYHIYLIEGKNKAVYLGRTGDRSNSFIWSSPSKNPINPAFKKGPQDGESYLFQVYALTSGTNPVIGPFSTDGPVLFRIDTAQATPTPTPSESTGLAENSVIVTDTVSDMADLSNGQDIDSDTEKELVIQWNFGKDILKDIHIYVSVNGAQRVFLGRTGKPTVSYFSWKPGSFFTNASFREGPVNGNSYLFTVFPLTESGKPAFLGPFSNAGPVQYSVTGTTPSPTLFPTRIPTTIPTGLPTRIPTTIPTSIPTRIPTTIPTSIPTRIPTLIPTVMPTRIPTQGPTITPTSLPIQRYVSFGDWVEENGVWKNTVTAIRPNNLNIYRLCILFKTGEYYYGIYILIGEDTVTVPVEISQKDASSSIVEAVLQIQIPGGIWSNVENASVSSSPSVVVKNTPTPTPQEPVATPTMTPTKKPEEATGVSLRLSNVPLDVHRRAADLLEDLRGSEMTPAWKETILADKVYPYYRPDVEGVAYYEFTLSPHGSIIVSTGKHDDPLVNLNDNEQGSLGDTLLHDAEKNGMQVAKLYKMDSFGFVGETKDGQLAARLGNLPGKIKGLDPKILDQTNVELTEIKNKPSIETKDDSEKFGVRVETISGPQGGSITIEDWTSWEEFRDSYANTYQVLIDKRTRDVADAWKVETMIQQNGIVLLPKKPVKLSLLFPNSKFTTEGDGAQFVHIRQDGSPAVLTLTVENPPAENTQFAVVITHQDGRIEKIKFFVPNPQFITIDDPKGEQPIAGGGALTPQSVIPQGWGSWSSWTYYYAGNSGDQRAYYQYTYSGCASGCGATGWAMLFGWADNQADEGNAYWSPRWGLYRENGGYGSDAVAPSTQDSGIENVTEEIHGYIETFCVFDAGATYPWKMDNAADYLTDRTGTDLTIHYNSAGVNESRLREYARDSIRDRETPAIIGTGWLQHYPLAWGYAWRVRYYYILGASVYTDYSRYFKLNQGWGGYGDGWESAETWFAGEIEP